MAVGTMMMPITIIKVRYESSFYRYRSISHAAASIWKQDGLRGFFFGAGATAMRDAPFAGTYVMLYEALKPVYSSIIVPGTSRHNPEYSHNTLVNIASSVTAGITSTVLTQPFDVLKTRLQLKPAEYRSTPYGFLKIARDEGFRGFFVGLMPRIIRKSLSSAITWTVYEEVSRMLTSYNISSPKAGAPSG
ncbi:hypothetical protein HDU96_006253 [Phlyctochytrium bullatum]|nr:hypothetical protein HDU96_006253 [Phlyctochytrium bullatum]